MTAPGIDELMLDVIGAVNAARNTELALLGGRTLDPDDDVGNALRKVRAGITAALSTPAAAEDAREGCPLGKCRSQVCVERPCIAAAPAEGAKSDPLSELRADVEAWQAKASEAAWAYVNRSYADSEENTRTDIFNAYVSGAALRLAEGAKVREPLTDVPFAIIYDDYDRRHEIAIGEAAARMRFADVGLQWNAHLFVKVESNSRDGSYASNNATLAAPSAQSQAPEPLVHIEPSGYISDWGQAARQEAVAAEPSLHHFCPEPAAAAPGEVEPFRTPIPSKWTDDPDYIDPREESYLESVAAAARLEVELPEPAAWMFPADLAAFAQREETAHAMSVKCTNWDTGEHSTPLYTEEQVRACIAAARAAGREHG